MPSGALVYTGSLNVAGETGTVPLLRKPGVVINIHLCLVWGLSASRLIVTGRVLFLSSAGEARDLGLQSSLVLRMTDSVDDGVVDGVALGKEGAPDGEEGSDHVGEVHSGEVDDAIRCPRDEPQGYIHKRNLSQLALVGSLLAFFVTKRLDSHLLGLFLHGLLVLENF